MINKLDPNVIEPTRHNVVNLVEKYNLLVELNEIAIHSQMKYQKLYEVNFEEGRILKEQNTSLLIQLDKIGQLNGVTN